MNPSQWPSAPLVNKLVSSFTRPLNSPMTNTFNALGAQTRKVAPSAIRFAPIAVPGVTWSSEAGIDNSGEKGLGQAYKEAGTLSPGGGSEATGCGGDSDPRLGTCAGGERHHSRWPVDFLVRSALH